MSNNELYSKSSSCLNPQINSKDSIQKYRFKNQFFLQSKDKILMKLCLKKRDLKLRQMKYQNLHQQLLDQAQKLNLRNENNILARQRNPFYQIKHKKKIIKDIKYKIIGGGCGSSKQFDTTEKMINFCQRKGIVDERFIQNYNYLTDKKRIVENIKYEKQVDMQAVIIEQLEKSFIHIIRNLIIYKTKVMKLIDVYLIYVLTEPLQYRIQLKEEQEIKGKKLKKIKELFERESIDFPTCDFIFYFDFLERINSTRILLDGYNQQDLNQAVKEVETLLEKRQIDLKKKIKGDDFLESINITQIITQFILNMVQQSQKNPIFLQIQEIFWKHQAQSRGRIFNMTLLEELKFYIKIFNEYFIFIQKDNEIDLILLILIKIDHYLSLALEDTDSLKTLSSELSLIFDQIKIFFSLLIQKSDTKGKVDEVKYQHKFIVENLTYRFLTFNIFLKYNKIIEDLHDSQEYKKQIIEYLCYQYLHEKNKSVKFAFETNIEFVEYFNSKIDKEEFKDKIIQLSNEKRKDLLLFDIEQHIETVTANKFIQKWEIDARYRILQIIFQKDDVLLEVKDLYIEQQITYLKGNKIFQPRQSLAQINEKNQPHKKNQNAFQEILDHFLIVNIKTNENQNVNESITQEQDKCKIIGILAESGTGKSMLIKKLETYLISSANSNSEKESYIPLLIKCNYLDPVKPSIDNYLLEQGVNIQYINSIKKSDRKKVILLDGYEEFTGEYFRVYYKLNLKEWINTKVIVASRKEKLDISEACTNFSLDDENGIRDETSFCIVKLEEFTNDNILEYYQMYFRKHRTNEEKFDEFQYKNDLDAMEDCMKNPYLSNLLYQPINLHLFTRMIAQVKDKNEILKIKENISDQIGIQDIFFKQQFKREALDFIQTCSEIRKKDKDLDQLIINSFFEYFQQISMKMFQNKGKIDNFLQIRKQQIEFKLSNKIENIFTPNEKNNLLKKIIYYVNSKIITISKEEVQIEITNQQKKQNELIEFKDKSQFDYFVSRAMKYDFDIHADNIYKLTIEQLKEFNINKKCIMNAGQNQSEQQILIKLYKMIKDQIESNEFYENYHLKQIEKNSRYIQYIKKSTIKLNTDLSQIDIGASNMLSTLFISKFTYDKLELNFCSFSRLYGASKKSDLINFEQCNLQNSYLKNLHLNYDSCNIEFATFDRYPKVFDTSNIFSFNKVIWDKMNILYTITETGFINAFKIENQNIVLQKSKQLSQTSLNSIQIFNFNFLLVSTQYSLLLINSNSLDLIKSYKFKNDISSITLIKENFLVTFRNETIFYGSFENGFRKIKMIGSGNAYNEQKQILIVYSKGGLSFYDSKKNFEHINTIQGHTDLIHSVAFSANGKYLASGSSDKICKIWSTEKGFKLLNTIYGHTNKINSVTFSEDGMYLATGSSDQTCKIWNAEKGFELINTIQGHNNQINSIAFSADGTYLATGSSDKTCKIWNAEKGFELINTIQGHTYLINSMSFSGKYLATGSSDQTCKIWNAEKGFELINTVQGHTAEINSVAFSADGKYLATGSSDQTYKIWNAEKGFELVNTILGHANKINSVAFSADGKYLATGSLDKTCKIWNAEKSFELINTIQGHNSEINSIAISADGKYLVTGSSDQTCKIWNLEKGFELINTIQGHTNKVNSVAFSEDGKYLATGSSDKTCKIWNTQKGFELIQTIQGHSDKINSVTFSSDGKYLSTSSKDKTCKIWNAEKGFELINTIQGNINKINSAAFSLDGKYLATSSLFSYQIWNSQKVQELINTNQDHTDTITSVAFSADGTYLATGSSDQTCKIWDTKKKFELVTTIQDHTNKINTVTFSSNGKYLATGSSDQTCKIWNAEKGFKLTNIIQDHTDLINSVDFSIDGRFLVTGSSDQTCKIWNVEKEFEILTTIQGHTNTINSVAFSADGKYLATGSSDQTCKIWNAEKGFELINTIQGHNVEINSVAFSADGKYLATGSSDQTCKIWHAEKGFELINTILGHANKINSVAFSADGKYLATGSSDKTCKIWNAEKGLELISTIYDHIGDISSIKFSLDGKYLTTGSFDKTCKINQIQTDFQLVNRVEFNTNSISSISFSEEGKYISFTSQDNTCEIYNIDEGIQLLTPKKFKEQINLVAFSKDGKYLAGSQDKTCTIWDAKDGFKFIERIERHTQQISSIAFSSDGGYLATGSYDKKCNIWRWDEQKCNFQFIKKIKHNHYISSITFSSDGKYLASGSSDKTCKIWNAQKNFDHIKDIQHDHYISSIVFSENGKYLATGSWDKTCKIWDSENDFKLIKTILNDTNEIFSVAFSKDNQYLSICSMNCNCSIWDIDNVKQGPIYKLDKVNKFQFTAKNEFIYNQQEGEYYKVYVIKDFNPQNSLDKQNWKNITTSLQNDQQNEMIYLKNTIQFKNIHEI